MPKSLIVCFSCFSSVHKERGMILWSGYETGNQNVLGNDLPNHTTGANQIVPVFTQYNGDKLIYTELIKSFQLTKNT